MKFIPKYRCPECGKEVQRKAYVEHLNACRLKAFRASVAASIARAA
jgi:uncharacterized C2H2 Zn-finger protein